MNITFLIGNGFDINLGLKTRYVDFYDYYQKHASEHSMILQLIRDDKNKEKWADLELALGEKLKEINAVNVDSFMDAHAELDSLLIDYLEEEQKKYTIETMKDEIVTELIRSLQEFTEELSAEEQRSYQATFDADKNESLHYNFITFNYTDILDEIIKKVKSTKPDLGTHRAINGLSKKRTLGEGLIKARYCSRCK